MIARQGRRGGRRRGVASLIEVIASMTMIAAMLGMTATMTTLLFRLERLGRDELAATIAQGRLAEDFRDDVRAAARVGSIEGGLDLIGPEGESVSYRFEDGAVVRRRGGEGASRIACRRGPRRWEPIGGEADRGVALVLVLPSRPGSPGGGRRVVRVEATPGRDHRFEGEGP